MTKEEARERLRQVLRPGDRVYTILRHVSRSGMARDISLYTIKDNKPYFLDGLVSHALDCKISKNQGLRVHGCGMDMGFDLVYQLAYALFGDGYNLSHEWL